MSKVTVSWDEDEPHRVKTLNLQFSPAGETEDELKQSVDELEPAEESMHELKPAEVDELDELSELSDTTLELDE
uniref:Uncharacterized protein n=1 Tax=Brassica oleracea var. oleracea TaxID=109376 RepID=A0A0D3B9C5_BRAOL